jgi:hypothetical protein
MKRTFFFTLKNCRVKQNDNTITDDTIKKLFMSNALAMINNQLENDYFHQEPLLLYA